MSTTATGFSAAGLRRLHDVLSRHVDSGNSVQLMHDFWTTVYQSIDD